jgi:hypothetical protein
MKLIHALLLVLALPLRAADDIDAPVTSPNHGFTISQVLDKENGWKSTLTFSNPKVPPLDLEPTYVPWAAVYSISPDSQWILRIQKTGSGENTGVLYHVEQNHRVSMIMGFNDALWRTSDTHSRIPRRQLSHTGISSHQWKTSQLLEVTLVGGNIEKSGDRMENIDYDLIENRFSVPQ